MFASHNMVITGGTFTQLNDNRHIQNGKGNIDRLVEASSPAAFHDSGDRRDPPKCHPNTRVAVLEKIKDWILLLDPEAQNALIMWLHGPAGSGKSAIAQSIAEWGFEEEILLASYFFSRFDPTRNHPRSLIATIAYQAASHFSSVRDRIMEAISMDPLIFTRSLITQIRTVIVEPLQSLIASGYFNTPESKHLIIIDGLDECEDLDGKLDVLRAISNALQVQNLPLVFLISSRPEHDITSAFSSGYLREATCRLPLDSKYQPYGDIKQFLSDEFNNIKENHPFKAQISPGWPAEEVLLHLVNKSSGQFIYAATVVKFIKSTRHRPQDRLDMVLGLRLSNRGRDMPFSELDALYHHVFSCVQEIEPVLQILAFHTLIRPSGYVYSLSNVERILSLNPGDIHLLFCDLHSVIDFQTLVPSDPSESQSNCQLQFLHASLEDFLLDKSRSKELYIDPPLRHTEFAQALFPQHPTTESGPYWEGCAYHLERASPSEKLRQDILDLDIPEFFRLGYDNLGVPSFLQSIKESQFVDAKELYLRHIQAFDKYTAEQLVKYYSEKRLTALVAVMPIFQMESDFHVFLGDRWTDLFQLNKKLQLMDLHGLQLIQIIRTLAEGYGRNYLLSLQDLFTNKRRLGVYALGPTTYANGAIHFLQYICYHIVVEIPWYLKNGHITRTEHPWKWRRTMAWKNHAFGRVHIKTWRKLRSIGTQNEKQWEHSKSLNFLSKLLQKSGRSEELINRARRCNFGRLSYTHLHETMRAKGELALYLERMNMTNT